MSPLVKADALDPVPKHADAEAKGDFMTGAMQSHPMGVIETTVGGRLKEEGAAPGGSEEERVRVAATGDSAAFSELMQAYWTPVFRSVLRMLHDEASAQDVSQRAFIRAWESLGTLKNPARFRSWMFAIALNLGRNELRGRARHRHVDVDKAGLSTPAVEVGDERQAQMRRVWDAVATLPTRQREVMTLRIEADLSFREIAEALGGTEGAARVNYCYAVKTLKAQLRGNGDRHEE